MGVEQARMRAAYGMLASLAGLVLCCFPVGIVGLMMSLSVWNPSESLPEPDRGAVRTRALVGIGLGLAATLLGLAGWTFALVSGCD